MSFSDIEEEKLINIVSKHPVIYDTGHTDYRNVLVKENVWKSIGRELNKSSGDCKKKWKFIRDGYHRFKKKNKLRTGSAAPKNSKDKRHRRLLFLDGVTQHTAGGSNIPASTHGSIENKDNNTQNDDEQQEGNIENTEMQKSDDEVLNNSENTVPKEQRTQEPKAKRPREEKRYKLLKTIVKRKDDDIDLFSRHIAEVLRNLPPIYKAEAKKHLSVVLSNYEIMAARNSAGSTCTDSRDINIPSTRSCSSLSQSPSHDFNASYTSPSSESAYELPEPRNTGQHINMPYTLGPVHNMTNAC